MSLKYPDSSKEHCPANQTSEQNNAVYNKNQGNCSPLLLSHKDRVSCHKCHFNSYKKSVQGTPR